ncbi:SufE family protein [Aggregatibacter actinomycetemcomitans]|uniref:SufE family protein n=1 Tax=Aggregatibacter actinomycetemcomitans TaxID=714 RepID=UPI0011D40DAE|nr:SufE family protein [Aggregatibacter actinomycetemcomitans]QEH45596.1 SufE family protein [Aggregatibacter actinomycetemcomitans]QEH47678.1 SufE family protein [Aggregatibacter actinomycetemcomitans]QEH49472.1 SufE family protein [Aggregatibacter actinomycetemcomitans]TYA49582.1 SufE family protein [Aggregatibacter actinomycetemcomitans]
MNIEQQLIAAKNWEDRYRLIIQAGKNLPEPSEEALAAMETIPGCEVQVWFKFIEKNDRTFHFEAYSEARIMNGLLWILLQHIENRSADALRQFDLTAYFTELGIAQRLSSTRLNGLKHIKGILHNL